MHMVTYTLSMCGEGSFIPLSHKWHVGFSTWAGLVLSWALSQNWTVFPSAYQLLEVRCGDSAFGVNLGEKTCACRLWQLSGIPCIHAVAGYMHLNRDPDEGVS
ncbi:zinc finger, PMZ-type containing protein [Tanacetum coccineum]